MWNIHVSCISFLIGKENCLYFQTVNRCIYIYMYKFTKTHQVNIQEKTSSKLKFPTKRDLHPILEEGGGWAACERYTCS